jgi:GNAT superfamily N-acetyltransferase
MLSKTYVKATYKWHVKTPSAHALVAEHDNRIVGLVGVSDTPHTWSTFKACLFELALSLVRNSFLVFEKKLWARAFRRLGKASKRSKMILDLPGIAQITIVAVDTRYRGLGIFDRLVESAKEPNEPRPILTNDHGTVGFSRSRYPRHLTRVEDIGHVECKNPVLDKSACDLAPWT